MWKRKKKGMEIDDCKTMVRLKGRFEEEKAKKKSEGENEG
jgi:hypothetical protein